MGKTAKDVMNKAISFLGVKESPANSNNVVFNTDYYGKSVNGAAYPWCCAYVWDIFRLAGAGGLFYNGNKTAYCPTVETWGKQKGLTVDKTKGQYGDIVLFDFSGKGLAGHIGFIVAKNSDGSYKTIEGNTAVGNDSNGGCVMYRTRQLSSIRCIIRPKYDVEKATTSTTTKKTTTKYDQKQFIKDVCSILGVSTAKKALDKTITISKSKNKNHKLITPLERYMKALGYYTGAIEADSKKTPDFGGGMESAIKKYQEKVVKAAPKDQDGIITAKAATWKKLLGLS